MSTQYKSYLLEVVRNYIFSDVVRITVLDVNDNEPVFQNRQQDSYEIDENTLNTIVGQVNLFEINLFYLLHLNNLLY